MAIKTIGTTADQDEIAGRSKDSAWMLPYWEKVDDIVEGYDAIKLAGEKYLPKFADEPENDYQTRLGFCKFTNIYRDVLEGLASKPFEEEVSLVKNDKAVTPPAINDFIEDVDGSGNNITVFAAQTFFNGINSAIDWILVDHPRTDRSVIISVADAKKAGIKPYWSRVLAMNVLEVRSEIIGREETLSYIRYQEFETGKPDRIRIYERDESGTVHWELWEKLPKTTEKQEYILVDTDVITINRIPMVPFTTGRRQGKSFKFYPPMRDAADLQISLYQDESGLQFIKTMSAYPMLAANGMKPEKNADGTIKKLAVGPSKVLYAAPDASGGHGEWKYVEPSSQNMEFLQESIKQTKMDLRDLGRQPLTAQSGQLTTVTTSVAAGKARSAVMAWALGLKDALENAIKITGEWMNVDADHVEVNVYSEFDNITEGDADLTALATMRENGDISQETLWFEMKRRKVLSPEFKAEQERARLLVDIPVDPVDGDTPNGSTGK